MGLLVSHDNLMEALMSLVEVGGSDVVEAIATITNLSQYEHIRLVVTLRYHLMPSIRSQLDRIGLSQLKNNLNVARQHHN